MSKIKILFEGISSNLGGIEKFVKSVYDKIDKEKYEISFLVDADVKAVFEEEYKANGCNFFAVTNRKNSYIQYLKDLKAIYKDNKFDIIHINMMSYSLFERITLACKYSKARVIVHCHNGGFSKDSKYKKTIILDKIGKIFVHKYMKKIIKVACSEKAGRFAFNNSFFTIINNGIDVEKFVFNQSARLKLRTEMGFDDDDFLILLVGMFNDFKNHEFLIDIFSKYKKLDKSAKLILVGEGYLQKKVKEQVNNLKLNDEVFFLGKRTDVNEILSMCDVYVMPSKSEGISLALIEAQVNGLMCYTSNNVDKNSDITGNVEFLSLDMSAEKWAKEIYNNKDKGRDLDAHKKIPLMYKSDNCFEKLFEIYEYESNNASVRK